MMRLFSIAALISLFALAGCLHSKPTYVDQSRVVVVTPPTSLYNCPIPPPPPNHVTLTNEQVVNYIDELRKRLVVCGINVKKIEEFVTQARKAYE